MQLKQGYKQVLTLVEIAQRKLLTDLTTHSDETSLHYQKARVYVIWLVIIKQ